MIRQILKNEVKKIQGKFQDLMLSKTALQKHLSSGITIQIENYSDWTVYNDIFVDGEYDLAIQKALNSVPQNRTIRFLDIGANVGFFTLRVADLIRRSETLNTDFEIVLIEGSPRVYQKLKSRLNNESGLNNKLRIIHGLVGEREGAGKIFETDFHVMNSTIQGFNYASKAVDVPYINLMDLYPGDCEINLLKCDIEGSEILFIKNYQDLLYRVKHAIFEFHYDRINISESLSILQKIGFVNHQVLHETPKSSLDLFWK